MPTDAKVRALLTSPGSNSPFEIARVNVRGFEVNAWKHANPSMRQLWLSSEANGAKPYLIYIDNELPLNGIDDPRIVKAPMLTYADTHFQSRSLAHYLISLGLKRGDRVAIAGRNCFEWIVAFWTIVSLGLIAVPINAWLKAEQMEYCLDMTEPRVIICDGERMQTFVEHGTFGRLGKKGLEKIVSMFPGRFLDNLDARGNEAWKQLKSSSTYTTFDSVLASGASIAKRNGDKFPDPLGPVPENHPFGNSLDIHPEEGATIFFSSGTSGFPKGCLGTHRSYCQTPLTSLYASAHAAVKSGLPIPPMPKPSDPTKIQLLSTPLYHITATKSRLGGSTFQGGAVAFMHHWNARDCLYVVSRMRISSIGGVPTMFFGVAEEVERFRALNENVDLSCITSFSYGGAPAPPALVKKLRELFPNVLIGQGLGQTEASNCVSVAGQDYLDHPGSVGRVNPVSELKIVEVTDWNTVPDGHVDKVLGVGEVGELCFRGANVIAGYWKDPESTKRAFRGGWLHSGDVGYIDKDGFVYLVDRSKQMIIRGGENIYTVQIEDSLYRFPGVWDAGAIGIPDPGIKLGELPVAAIVVPPHSRIPTSDEVRAHCAKELGAFAVPVYVDVRTGDGKKAGENEHRGEGLPRNVNGKLNKDQLRKEILERMEKEGVIEALKSGGGKLAKL